MPTSNGAKTVVLKKFDGAISFLESQCDRLRSLRDDVETARNVPKFGVEGSSEFVHGQLATLIGAVSGNLNTALYLPHDLLVKALTAEPDDAGGDE